MEFLFLKILLAFLGISYSLPFLNAKVVMEPSSDDFPTIQDLKSSISFNQTFIPFDMSDCYFETIENVDVICDASDWTDEDMDQIELPGKIRYLALTIPFPFQLARTSSPSFKPTKSIPLNNFDAQINLSTQYNQWLRHSTSTHLDWV